MIEYNYTNKEGFIVISGIHHISMKCQSDTEYEKAKKFYIDILGLSILKECESCILMNTDNGIIEVFRNASETLPQGAIRHFAFTVNNIEEIAKSVENAGYEVFVKPKKINIGNDPDFPATIAFCKGPLGEDVEFFQQEW